MHEIARLSFSCVCLCLEVCGVKGLLWRRLCMRLGLWACVTKIVQVDSTITGSGNDVFMAGRQLVVWFFVQLQGSSIVSTLDRQVCTISS